MDLSKLLSGRSVLITGASSGLGEHFARVCATAGARIALAARRTERLASLKRDLLDGGAADVFDVALDVTDEASIGAAVGASFERFGGLDVVVNNAGLANESAVFEQTTERFDAVIDTNLRGVWLMSMEAAKLWRKAGEPGTIVNIASIAGFRPAGGMAAYAISKAGVVQLTKVLAQELARYRIRVNALAPGYIETPLNAELFDSEAGKKLIKRIPMRRLGQMEELDAPFLLLATEAGSFMTGSILVADGGHLVSSL